MKNIKAQVSKSIVTIVVFLIGLLVVIVIAALAAQRIFSLSGKVF